MVTRDDINPRTIKEAQGINFNVSACVCGIIQGHTCVCFSCLKAPLPDYQIIVISESLYGYRLHIPGKSFTQTPESDCWSHAPPPSPLQSAIHHSATTEGEDRRGGAGGVRQRRE